jgi:hypothetical protein
MQNRPALGKNAAAFQRFLVAMFVQSLSWQMVIFHQKTAASNRASFK